MMFRNHKSILNESMLLHITNSMLTGLTTLNVKMKLTPILIFEDIVFYAIGFVTIAVSV